MLAITVVVLLSPLAARWFSLWQISDVALPFDVEDVIRPDLPAHLNAFNGYVAANSLARRQVLPWSDAAIDAAIRRPDPLWDIRLDEWLADNHEALAEYRRASDLTDAGAPSLQTADAMDSSQCMTFFAASPSFVRPK